MYDRVEWSFLEGTMKKLGFCDGWIHFIGLGLATYTFTVPFYIMKLALKCFKWTISMNKMKQMMAMT